MYALATLAVLTAILLTLGVNGIPLGPVPLAWLGLAFFCIVRL